MNLIEIDGLEIPIIYDKNMKKMKVRVNCDIFTVKSNPSFKPNEVRKFIETNKGRLEYYLKKNKTVVDEIKNRIENGNYELSIYDDESLKHILKLHVRKYEDARGNPNHISVNKRMVKNWGTCSAKRNLTFNPRMKYLPQHLIEYIVYHEMCHLTEPSHNSRFWKLMREKYPNYEELDKELRVYEYLIDHKEHKEMVEHAKFLDELERKYPENEVEVV